MPNYGDTRGGYNIWRFSYGVTSCRGNRGIPLLVPYISHGCCKVVDAGGWLYGGKEALQKHQRLCKETVLRWRRMEKILPRFYSVFNALHSGKCYFVLCCWDAEEVPSSLDRNLSVNTSLKLVEFFKVIFRYAHTCSIFSGSRRNLCAQVTAVPKMYSILAVFRYQNIIFYKKNQTINTWITIWKKWRYLRENSE